MVRSRVGAIPSRRCSGFATPPGTHSRSSSRFSDMAKRISLAAAVDEVAARDPVLAHLVALAGPIKHRPRDPDGPFGALLRAIVYQQLAGRAAHAIFGRVRSAVGETLTPEALAAVPDDALRAAGLSANKLASLRDLSTKIIDGSVDLKRASRLSDD